MNLKQCRSSHGLNLPFPQSQKSRYRNTTQKYTTQKSDPYQSAPEWHKNTIKGLNISAVLKKKREFSYTKIRLFENAC